MASKIISLIGSETYEVSVGEIIEKATLTATTSTSTVTLFSRILFKKEGGNFTLDTDGEGVQVSSFSALNIEGPFYKVTTDANSRAILYIK